MGKVTLTETDWQRYSAVEELLRTKQARDLIRACRAVGINVERIYAARKKLREEETLNDDDMVLNENHS